MNLEVETSLKLVEHYFFNFNEFKLGNSLKLELKYVEIILLKFVEIDFYILKYVDIAFVEIC